MRKSLIAILLLFFSLLMFRQNLNGLSGASGPLVYRFDIMEEIGPAIWRKTIQAFREAEKMNADYFLIHMNTYGGTLNDADSIRSRILRSNIPVLVFIDNNAASAGALISIACNSIYMRKGASIGAATVVNQQGEAMPDKYQSYMRSMMRSTAEARGRDPQIAQAMVDPRIIIKGIIDSTMVLTFTTSEAIKNGYCEGEAESIEEMLDLAHIENYRITEYKATFIETIIGFFVNPVISGLLVMIIIGGIYFELQTPGIGFPIIASVIAAILYFAPLYLEGLADNWEILLFIGGLVMIIVEILFIPGFGAIGISGIICAISGLALSLVGNRGLDFSFTYGTDIVSAFLVVFIAIVVAAVASLLFGGTLFNSAVFQRLVLQDVQLSSKGYTGADSTEKALVGKTGLTVTILRPSGKIIIDNDVYDATAQTGYIEKGEKIKVIKFETAQLIVRKENK